MRQVSLGWILPGRLSDRAVDAPADALDLSPRSKMNRDRPNGVERAIASVGLPAVRQQVGVCLPRVNFSHFSDAHSEQVECPVPAAA